MKLAQVEPAYGYMDKKGRLVSTNAPHLFPHLADEKER